MRSIICAFFFLLSSLTSTGLVVAQPVGYRIDAVAPPPPNPIGEEATDALLRFPFDVTVDNNGRIAFLEGNRVLAVSPEGRVSLLAGTGESGYGGDGGPATEATFVSANAVAFGPQGRLYIADKDNHRIRCVESDGTIRTVAGTGQAGFSGDRGLATQARLDEPVDIGVAPNGDLYIADSQNLRIRKVDNAGMIETAFGNGEFSPGAEGGEPAESTPISGLRSLDVGPDGTVYFVQFLPRVFAVGEDGLLDPVSLPGGAVVDGIPFRVAAGPGGDVYFTDFGNSVYRRSPEGSLTRIASGPATERMSLPSGFSGDGGPASSAQLNSPTGIDVGPDGSVIVADVGNHRLRRIADGIIDTIAGRGRRIDPRSVQDAELFAPAGIALDANGDLVIASPLKNALDRIVLRPAGRFDTVRTIAGDGLAGFTPDGEAVEGNRIAGPQGVTRDPSGRLLFADQGNDRVRVLNADGTLSTFAGGGEDRDPNTVGPASSLGIPAPVSIDVGEDGRALIPQAFSIIRIIDAGGVMRRLTGGGGRDYAGDGGPATDAKLDNPLQARFAPNGEIFISDSGNHAIRRIDSQGVISTVAGDGEAGFRGDGARAAEARLNRPVDLAFAPNGDLFIADQLNGRVRVVRGLSPPNTAQSAPPTIETIGGGGESRVLGGLATDTAMGSPTGLALGADGVLYVSDVENEVVHRLTPVSVRFTGAGLVHSASFAGGPAAAEQIVSLFGEGLADSLQIVDQLPLPTTLAGTTVEVTDTAGTTRPCPLFFVSPAQINLQLPPGLTPGSAILTVRRGGDDFLSAEITIERVAPGLYSANARGAGVAAAQALRIGADGGRTVEALFDSADLSPSPLDLGPEGEQVFLLLFGSGVRGFQSEVAASVGDEAVSVLGAGAQGQFVGLDQINIGPLPRSLVGRGEVEIVITVDGLPANTVTVSIL